MPKHASHRSRSRETPKEAPRLSDFGGRVRFLREYIFNESEEAFVERFAKRGHRLTKSSLGTWWGISGKRSDPGLSTAIDVWRALRPDGISLRWLMTGEGDMIGEVPVGALPDHAEKIVARHPSPVVSSAVRALAIAHRDVADALDWSVVAREFEDAESRALSLAAPPPASESERELAAQARASAFDLSRGDPALGSRKVELGSRKKGQEGRKRKA